MIIGSIINYQVGLVASYETNKQTSQKFNKNWLGLGCGFVVRCSLLFGMVDFSRFIGISFQSSKINQDRL
jgi:hypothetical protein